jgi:Ca-activated chloride channel family protein
MGNHNDHLLEQLADRGDGICNYVDDEAEARRALVEGFTGAFEPIARDVKIQVEFDPGQVFRYRLLGYENRAIADASFRDDSVDAGELGAGHQVVALYELELLRHTAAPLATVRLRWKPPTGAGRDPLEDAAAEFATELRFDAASSWEGSSAGYKRAVLVAQFAELLRGSTHARHDSLEELIVEAGRLERELRDPDFSEFLALLDRSLELVRRKDRERAPLDRCADALRRQQYERAQCEALGAALDPRMLEQLEREGRELETRIRELVRESVEARY